MPPYIWTNIFDFLVKFRTEIGTNYSKFKSFLRVHLPIVDYQRHTAVWSLEANNTQLGEGIALVLDPRLDAPLKAKPAS